MRLRETMNIISSDPPCKESQPLSELLNCMKDIVVLFQVSKCFILINPICFTAVEMPNSL